MPRRRCVRSAQTMRQKKDGDIADIPQTVRWQAELFARFRRPGAAGVVKRSNAFLASIRDAQGRCRGLRAASGAAEKPFERAAAGDASGGLKKLLEEIATAKDPTALQRAHRAFLLELDRLR